MALPVNHTFNEIVVSCHTASCGGTPISAAARAPLRGKIVKLSATLAGVLTADATCAATINGTAITGGSLTMVASGSTVGTTFTVVPTALNFCNEDDFISFPATGGTGSNIPCTYQAVIRPV